MLSDEWQFTVVNTYKMLVSAHQLRIFKFYIAANWLDCEQVKCYRVFNSFLLWLKLIRAINVIRPSALWVCFVLIILTYISAAAASPSPCAPALSAPSLSPCGQLGRMIRPHSRWRCRKQHEDGRSSAGWLQPEHESLSPWERTNHTALFYWPCAIWTDEVLNVAPDNIWYCQCYSFSRCQQSHFMFSKCILFFWIKNFSSTYSNRLGQYSFREQWNSNIYNHFL